MNNKDCIDCHLPLNGEPSSDCQQLSHWEIYATFLQEKLEMRDDERDKLDVAEWLLNYEKIREYKCSACNREYQIPVYLNYITCVCGLKCRLRYIGGYNPDHAVIDAAMSYFGNERSAQLAHIAQIIANPHFAHYTGDEIRKMIKEELDCWELKENGWARIK